MSYVRRDPASKAFIGWLKKELLLGDDDLDFTDDLIDLSFDEQDLLPGQHWEPGLRALVADSEYLVTIISQGIYLDVERKRVRHWIEREAHWAEMLEADPYRLRPFQSFVILIDDAPLPDQWKHKHRIDLRGWNRDDEASKAATKATLKKLRLYVRSHARLKQQFVDRDDVLEFCLVAQRHDSDYVIAIHNSDDRAALGGTWLLRHLRVLLDEPGTDRIFGMEIQEIADLVIHFEFEELKSALGRRPAFIKTWMQLLDITVERLGGIEHFPNYRRARESLMSDDVSSSASPTRARADEENPPLSVSADARQVSFLPARGGAHAVPERRLPGIQEKLRNKEVADRLTQALLDDLDARRHDTDGRRNGVRVLWLLDWPATVAIGQAEPVELKWLQELLCKIHGAANPYYPRIILASRKPVLPEDKRRAIGLRLSRLNPFTEKELLEYVRLRLPTRDQGVQLDIARRILNITGGRPAKMHTGFVQALMSLIMEAEL